MEHREVMSINLARLLKEGGTVRASGVVREAFLVGEERFPLEGEATWQVSVSSVGGDEYWLSGEVKGVALMECRRCLKPTPTPIHAYFQHMLRYEQGLEAVAFHEEAEDEYYAFGKPDLDLLPFLTEAFVTEMPYTVLCQEGCKGLCPVCGADRNLVDCGHEEEGFHPFTALKNLLPEL
ncbi:DUF177 domain-containing protein [Thermus oshimai]|jgi:uncharacterized protein|uniref:Putative metal-binding protein, possibly nucleic-acid binding protein n=1 Tax=Thermus oshimai JL-2 TaxID=751945 RepID=K7RGN4_THEOS|nr:DUF177 domain-containing protein [Thermus oshimai]AFV75737.1 putative metal-binding protein, possibly nucleic-acid binding protein [Thermus oshimai JL-2]